jgi:transposase
MYMERMTRRVFTKEFKLEAVKLVKEQGYSKLKAAKSLGITDNSLALWIKQHDEGKLMQMPGPMRRTPEQEELLKLRRELQEARMERDILKKAAAYFAKHSK